MKKIMVLIAFLLSLISLLISAYAETEYQKTIVLDAGHGGMDGGASVGNILEADLTLQFVLKMKEVFEENDFKVILTRRDKNDLCENEFVKKEDMAKRAAIINQSNAQLALSIHMNKFSIQKYRGAQTFYSDSHPHNLFLADTLQNNLEHYLKNTNRSIVKRDNIYLLNHVVIPCCIVECGFMSNPEELALLKSDEYQYQFAKAVLIGVENYLLLR